MRITEGIEEKLGQILNDPDSMAKIMSMAKSFGMPSEAPAEPSAPPLMDEGMMLGLMQMMQAMQHSDGKQEALLQALKPYLAPARQAKLDRAMELARISHIAGFALKNNGNLFGK